MWHTDIKHKQETDNTKIWLQSPLSISFAFAFKRVIKELWCQITSKNLHDRAGGKISVTIPFQKTSQESTCLHRIKYMVLSQTCLFFLPTKTSETPQDSKLSWVWNQWIYSHNTQFAKLWHTFSHQLSHWETSSKRKTAWKPHFKLFSNSHIMDFFLWSQHHAFPSSYLCLGRSPLAGIQP